MKTFFLGFCTFLLLISCKTSTPAASTKIDNHSEVMMKGDWTITSVKYPGSEYIKVNSFQIADSKCFEQSTWKFISNNNKGNMAIVKSGCSTFSSDIKWYVNKEGQFVLKFIFEGEKAKNVKEGYVLAVANQTATSFQLIDKMNVGGKMTDIVYQFEKVN